MVVTSMKILCSDAKSLSVQKLQIAADLVGVHVTVSTDSSVDKDCANLVTPEGVTLPCSIGLRHLGRLRPDLGYYGRTLIESSLVDLALQHTEAHVAIPLEALEKFKDPEDPGFAKVKADLCGAVERCTAGRFEKTQFLAGDRMTVADIDFALTLHHAVSQGVISLEKLPSIERWYTLMMNQAVVKKYVAKETKQSEPKKKPAASTTDTTPAPKAGPTAEESEAQIEAELKAKAKRVNPLDALEPSPLVLDEWKREYSNCKDLKGIAMPWFWHHYDKKGWSLWYMRYEKMEGECTVGYATANMLGGFLQRVDPAFRKYSFSVLDVVGAEKAFDIQGVWLLRGQEIPFELTDHPSYEYYHFHKLNPETDKTLIEDYWCNDDSVEGRPIDSCKVWK